MKNLDKFRKEIDLIDDKILSLLKKRSKLALNIGNIKNKNSSNPNLFRPERQFKILTRLFLKKNNFFSVNDIFSFWREIFSHQTNLQGGIDFSILNILKKPEKKMIFEAFGYDISIKTYKSLTRTFEDIKNKNNRLLILPYPGKMKRSSWWRNKGFKGLYIISAIPFINKNQTTPQLVVVSNKKPILEGDYSFLYTSTKLIKEKNLKKINQLKSSYLYLSKSFLNYDKLEFLGAYPNLKI